VLYFLLVIKAVRDLVFDGLEVPSESRIILAIHIDHEEVGLVLGIQ
jgi:hypothetical protein